MVTPADIARLCSGLGDPSSEALCRQSFTGCEDSWTTEPARSSCTALTTSCAEQRKAGKSTFELAMPSGGRLELPSVEACFRTAERITKAFWPMTYREPPPDRHPPPPDHPPPDPPPPPAGAEHCKDAGETGTPEFAKCQELVGACLAKGSGVYALPMGSQTIFVADQAGCLRMAPRIARAQFDRPPVEEKSAAPGAVAPPAAFVPDGKTRFGIGFAQAGFRLRVAADGTSEKLLLIPQYQGARKFVRVGISYRIEEMGGGRYRLTYAIASPGGGAIGGEEAIEIRSGDGLHLDGNLGFGITLNSEGSFGSIASVKIVTLAG